MYEFYQLSGTRVPLHKLVRISLILRYSMVQMKKVRVPINQYHMYSHSTGHPRQYTIDQKQLC